MIIGGWMPMRFAVLFLMIPLLAMDLIVYDYVTGDISAKRVDTGQRGVNLDFKLDIR